MAGSDTTSPPLRAVVLSHDPVLGARALRLCADGWRAVRVDSGYEAVAEILSAPVAVLLIDLRSLGGLHRGLLALARRMEVRLAAIAGETPPDMTGDDLQGLRRIEVGDIPATLASVRSSLAGRVESFDEPTSGDALPVATHAPATPEPAPETVPAPGAEQSPAPVPAPMSARGHAPTEVPPAQEKRVVLTPKSGKHKTLAGLLTPDELAFLMEDEQ